MNEQEKEQTPTTTDEDQQKMEKQHNTNLQKRDSKQHSKTGEVVDSVMDSLGDNSAILVEGISRTAGNVAADAAKLSIVEGGVEGGNEVKE